MFECLCVRYKRELEAALERESVLTRGKAQLELDWQRRCDDVERSQYEKCEQLLRSVTHARDEVSRRYVHFTASRNCRSLAGAVAAEGASSRNLPSQ